MLITDLYPLDLMIKFVQEQAPNSKIDPLAVVERYQSAVINEISSRHNLRDLSDQRLDLYLVSTHRLAHACQRYGPRNHRQSWWFVLHQQFPYIKIVVKGSRIQGLNKSGSLTKVKVLFEMNWMEKCLEDTLIHTQAQQEPAQYEFVPIDIASLQAFAQRTHSEDYRQRALKLLAIAQADMLTEQYGCLPMLKAPAASGRMYYKGTNLQNTPEVIRHAALGHHHSYDLRSSVYAWQLYMLTVIRGLEKYSKPAGTVHLRELLAEKTRIRTRLAGLLTDLSADLEFRIKLVKEAITAIGFGARSTTAYYDAAGNLKTQGLAGIIMNKTARTRFLADPWVKGFIAEQDAIGREITAAVVATIPEYKTDPVANRNGKFSRKQLLAFLYQQHESRLIKQMLKWADSKGYEPILWVHDGFCTRSPMNLADANWLLQEQYGDGTRLEVKHHNTWAQTHYDEQAERQARHQAEIVYWSQRGADMTTAVNSPVKNFSAKRTTAGHYADSLGDYALGRDPYANSTGAVRERQMIQQIYGTC